MSEEGDERMRGRCYRIHFISQCQLTRQVVVLAASMAATKDDAVPAYC